MVENHFVHLKILRIIKEKVRNHIEEPQNILFTAVVALYNFRRTFALKRKIIYL
jgi:hypothetical protein